MASVNKVILIGNVGRDPEFFNESTPVANLSLATTAQWKDRNTGERREETEWHRLVAFGRLAEIIQQYVRKGSSLYIEGRLKTTKYQDKATGTDRYSTSVIVDNLQLLGHPDSRSSNQDQAQQPPAQSTPNRQSNAANTRQASSGDNSYAQAKSGATEDDQIPF